MIYHIIKMKSIAEHIKVTLLISKASISNKWRLYLYVSNKFNLNLSRFIILRNLFNLLLVCIAFYITSKRAGENYEFILIAFSYWVITVQVFSPLFYTEQQIFRRYNYNYWSSQTYNRDKYSVLLLDAITIEVFLKNVGIFIPMMVLIVLKNGAGSIFLVISGVLLCQIIHFVRYFKRNKKMKLAKVISYLLTSLCLSSFVYFFFSGLYIFINYARLSISKYGFTDNFVQKTNHEINNKLENMIYNFGNYISGKYTNKTLILLISITLLLSFILIIVRKQAIEPNASKKITSKYMEIIYNLFSNSFTYINKINLHLGRILEPLWNHCTLDIIFPFETWAYVMVNYATSQYVHNIWAISILFFFEMYLICVASYRNIMGNYRDIYEFGLELKSMYLFKCLDDSKLREIFFEKLRSLLLTTIPVIVLNQCIILFSYMLFFRKISIIYLNLLLLPLLIFIVGIWCLRPLYDKFKYIIRSNYIINSNSESLELREIAGGDIIGKSMTIPIRVVLYCLIFVILIGSSFGLISGSSWMYVYIASTCLITILLFINSLTTILQFLNLKINIFSAISRTKIFIVITFFELLVFFAGVMSNLKEVYTINPTHLEFLPLLKHNLFILLMVIVYGTVTFGLGGVAFGSITIYKLGTILRGVVTKYGLGPIVTGVLPHAFFELSAILLAMLIGFEPFRQVLIYQMDCKQNLKLEVKNICILVLISITLLIIAALIESGVSHV